MTRKKDFTTKETIDTRDTVRAIATNDTKATSRTRATKNTPATKAEDDKAEYRYNARFTMREWAYITEKKWRTRKTVTAILQELIEEDMKKHPEIIKTIDELNN